MPCLCFLNLDDPSDLQPILHLHRQIHEHCLYLERVLGDAADKTGLSCFPVIVGRKPTAPPLTPSSSQAPSLRTDKENLSPASNQSYKMSRNALAQVSLIMVMSLI